MSADAQGTRPAGTLAGIGLAVLAFALYTTTDTIIKWVTALIPIYQIILTLAATNLIVFLIVARARGSLARVRTRHLSLHLLRALAALSGGFGAFYAYSKMPLADAYALIFAGPLFVTALSVPVLKEHVGWRRWSAVLVGFLGVVVMLRPGTSAFEPAALGALFAALGYAATVMMVRKLGSSESPYSYGIYGNILTIAITGTLGLAFGFIPINPLDFALLVGGGVVGSFAFLSMVAAYSRAPAAVVAPFQYSQMIWGTLAGYLVWRHTPDAITLVGAGIVATSGLYILHRETMHKRPTTPPVPETVREA